MRPVPGPGAPPRLFSVIIPAWDEEGSVAATVENVFAAFERSGIPHEIVVVDDGSADRTGEVLESLREKVPTLRPARNPGPHGFGRAVVFGLERMKGDAAVIMMADGSDDPADAVRYWEELGHGFDCVFGSRFVAGGKVEGYPPLKLVLNRLGNTLLRRAFHIPLNDVSNAFKAYRRQVIEAGWPYGAAHFDLTLELPLKAVNRRFTWTVIPVGWRNRRTGRAKLRVFPMGSRYLLTAFRLWRERAGGRRPPGEG